MGVVAWVKPWESSTAHCGAPSSKSSRGSPDSRVREGLFLVGLVSSGTADVGGIGLCSLTKKPVSEMFWLSVICCSPSPGNVQILAGFLSWPWGEGGGAGAGHLPVARAAAVVLGQV